MSERRVRLSKKVVETAAAEAARYALWDTDLKGFGLRVSPGGTKTFFIQYRPKSGPRQGRKQFMTLGRATDRTVQIARDDARKVRGVVAAGGDPAAARSAQAGVLTLGAIVDLFVTEHIEPRRKPATLAQYPIAAGEVFRTGPRQTYPEASLLACTAK